MVQSFARRSPRQNPLFDGKDKLASGTPTKDSDHCTPAPTATGASTTAVVLIVAPLVFSGSANSFVVRYLEDDLQRIVKTILDARPFFLPAFAPIPALVIVTTPYYKGPRERPLKARFPDIYWGKTYIVCYNFFQQCKDYFATAGATGPNRVPFAATFLKDIALFCCQQH